mmetsp:Transcript_15857/g.36378  ORF Transcript_15857/g.36378 Transcript_15857/m.36378 type:complete len:136 (+) Transcript_15857:1083-1490(+)
MAEHAPMSKKTRVAPTFGAKTPEETPNDINKPATIGPSPLAMLPPSIHKPFIVPRCDCITVRLTEMAMLAKNTRPKIRMKLNKRLRYRKEAHVMEDPVVVVLKRSAMGANATSGALNMAPSRIDRRIPYRSTTYL